MSLRLKGTSGLVFPDATTMASGAQACKAWVIFDGSTGAIIGGYNVSSITHPGTGGYIINFSTPMENTNYTGVAMFGNNANAFFRWSGTRSTTQFSITGVHASQYAVDTDIGYAIIFG